MFKVNNKNTSVSIVNFEQVNAGWSYFSSTALFIYSDTSSFVSTLKYEILFRRIHNIKLVFKNSKN